MTDDDTDRENYNGNVKCTIHFIDVFRSFAKLKKLDSVHSKDIGTMSVDQLNSNIQENLRRDRTVVTEMQ